MVGVLNRCSSIVVESVVVGKRLWNDGLGACIYPVSSLKQNTPLFPADPCFSKSSRQTVALTQPPHSARCLPTAQLLPTLPLLGKRNPSVPHLSFKEWRTPTMP